MEPAREPDIEAAPDAPEAGGAESAAPDIADILRQATLGLRLTTHDPNFLRGLDDAAEFDDPPLEEPVWLDDPSLKTELTGVASPPPSPGASVRAAMRPVPTFAVSPAQIAACALGLVTAAVWLQVVLATPAATQVAAIDPAFADASARWMVVLTSQRIDEFRRRYHRTPSRLEEIGPPGSALIGYERLADDRYRLSAPSPGGTLVYDSMRSRADFLGRSEAILTHSAGTR